MELQLEGVAGLSARHQGVLHLSADGKQLIHPLGGALVARDTGADFKHQDFLPGTHSHEVTCAALSPSGKFLATGQLTSQGLQAPVLIRDLQQQPRVAHELALHRAKVQAIGFSCNEEFVATLGGEDDGNVAIWDLSSGAALAGAPACNGFARCLAFLRTRPTAFVTAGQSSLRLWEYDRSIRKLRPADAALGATTRNFSALEVDPSDALLYAGTSTGDVVQFNLSTLRLRNSGPAKAPIAQGVTALKLLPQEGKLVCGGGAGSLTVLAVDSDLAADPKALKKFSTVASAQISDHALTSLVLDPAHSSVPGVGGQGGSYAFYCATAGSELFRVVLDVADGSITKQLLQTAHPGRINDLALPHRFDEVCATASKGGIRVWHLPTLREVLHIAVPGVDCRALCFAQDGKSIITGCTDGKIRAFGPQSGKPLYTIHDAHPGGVTAVAGTADSGRLMSGGADGTVRVWRIGRDSQVLEHSMKEHKAAVNCIALRENGAQCATASSDGSSILWCLRTYRRVGQLLDNTFFTAIRFHPEGSEVVTAGTDKRISYWDARSGEALRKLEASTGEGVNCLALSAAAAAMVSGGSDKLVKAWGFDYGRCYFVGSGHSSGVTQVRVASDGKHVVSVGAEGALMVWRLGQLPAVDAALH